MQNSEFEKSVQASMEALRLQPADAVWEQVEASLPPEKKPRRFLFFVLLAALLAGSLFVWNGLYREQQSKGTGGDKRMAQDVNDNKADRSQHHPSSPVIGGAVVPSGPELDSTDHATDAAIQKSKQPIHNRIMVKNGIIANDAMNTLQKKKAAEHNDITAGGNISRAATTGSVKVKITAPAADTVAIAAANIISNREHSENDDHTTPDTLTDDIAIADTGKLVKKTAKDKKWLAGFEANGGVSFATNNQYQATLFNSSAAGVSNPGTQGRNAAGQVRYNPGFSWGAGVYAKKMLGGQFSIYTGLRYQFFSFATGVGNRIDSSLQLNFGLTGSLRADNYYYPGTIKKYNNRVHVLEWPVSVQLQPMKGSSFYVAFGPSVNVLLHSNALVYNSGNAVYVSSNEAYSKLFISLHAGAGILAGRHSKRPFETGVKAGYMLNSVIKNDYGKLRPLSADVYMRIPFSKKNR